MNRWFGLYELIFEPPLVRLPVPAIHYTEARYRPDDAVRTLSCKVF